MISGSFRQGQRFSIGTEQKVDLVYSVRFTLALESFFIAEKYLVCLNSFSIALYHWTERGRK